MTTGTYISGIGHGVLILWLLLGGWVSRDLPKLPEAADVSLVSLEEFALLSAPRAVPDAEISVTEPEPPAADAPPERPSQTEDPPQSTDAPEAEPPAEPDLVPETPEPLAPVEQPVNDDVAVLVPPVADIAVPELAPTARPPQPQAAPRVAPMAVPEAPNDPQIADTASPAVSPDAETDQRAETEQAAAPEQATTEIVTEAEQPSGSAPLASLRPQARPQRPVRAAEPAAAPPADSAPAADPIADAVAAAVADAPSNDAPAAADLPVGPPLTGGEKDALRVAVQQCWNVGSLSSDALGTTVVVAVSMLPDGRPDAGTIRMLGSSGGSAEDARQAFEAARRAIIRCGATGYDLPAEKYGQWRDIEITFNPENMRIK